MSMTYTFTAEQLRRVLNTTFGLYLDYGPDDHLDDRAVLAAIDEEVKILEADRQSCVDGKKQSTLQVITASAPRWLNEALNEGAGVYRP